MEHPVHDMAGLFDQLGLPSAPAAIEQFIDAHSPLPGGVVVWEAPFWTRAQADFLRENLLDDADWAEVIDALSRELQATR